MLVQQMLLMVSAGGGSENYWINVLQNSSASATYELDDHLFDSSGNIVVAGTSDNNHFWHKIDDNGSLLVSRGWRENPTGAAADSTSIEIDSSDNIYAAIGNARFIKWDSSNSIVYSKKNTWSASNQAYGDSGVGGGTLTLSGNTLTYYSIGSNRRAMQVDASTGETTSATTASAGNTLFGVGGFGKTSQGNFLCGYVQSPSTNNHNYWMVATTSLSQQFCFYSESTASTCRGIDYINGNYYIVGLRQTDNSFAGDALIYKIGSYSNSGNQGILSWSRRIRNINNTSNGSYQSQFYDVAGDSEGNIYTVGHSPNPGTTQGGIIMKFNSSGSVTWSRFIEHTDGATFPTKITIDSNDTMWVNIRINGSVNKCAVAKLPTNGEFMGNYCGFTITDWSSGFTSSSFSHNAQSGAVPTFFSGGSSLTLGSSTSLGYTEPTVSPTECISVAGVISSVTESATSFNEGQQLDVDITTVDSDDGTVLYWQVAPVTGTVNSSDFSAFSGSVTVSSNAAQISITMANDSATEGTEQFVVKIYSEAQFTNVLGTTNTITINDTSTAPTQHSHSSGTVNVPANAYDISIELAGGAGGKGGAGGASRSNGGSGRTSWFTINLTPPFTVNLWSGTKGLDAYDPPVGDPTFPSGCSGWASSGSGSSSVGMNGGAGGNSGGIDQAGTKSCNVGGGGAGGAGSLIQINGTYVCIAGGGGGGGGSAGSTTGDSGGNYSGYGGSTPWVATTSNLENGSGASGGSGTDTNDAAAGGGSGGGASYTAVAAGAAGGSNASSVGQGGGSGVSAYRSDILNQTSNSHNPNSNGWTWVYYKTP